MGNDTLTWTRERTSEGSAEAELTLSCQLSTIRDGSRAEPSGASRRGPRSRRAAE